MHNHINYEVKIRKLYTKNIDTLSTVNLSAHHENIAVISISQHVSVTH